ncbi:MAG: RNA polymerase sigma factor [Candidatus Muiribacteriota bacterium]
MNEKEFDKIYEKYFDKIYFYVLSITCNPEDAKDISQETFIKIFTSEKDLTNIKNLKAYIFRIARNLTMDKFRLLKKIKIFLSSIKYEDVYFYDENKEKKYMKLLSSLKMLKNNDRNILHLRYYENMSYDEISECEKVKTGTVMSRLNRAKSALKEVMINDRTK